MGFLSKLRGRVKSQIQPGNMPIQMGGGFDLGIRSNLGKRFPNVGRDMGPGNIPRRPSLDFLEGRGSGDMGMPSNKELLNPPTQQLRPDKLRPPLTKPNLPALIPNDSRIRPALPVAQTIQGRLLDALNPGMPSMQEYLDQRPGMPRLDRDFLYRGAGDSPGMSIDPPKPIDDGRMIMPPPTIPAIEEMDFSNLPDFSNVPGIQNIDFSGLPQYQMPQPPAYIPPPPAPVMPEPNSFFPGAIPDFSNLPQGLNPSIFGQAPVMPQKPTGQVEEFTITDMLSRNPDGSPMMGSGPGMNFGDQIGYTRPNKDPSMPIAFDDPSFRMTGTPQPIPERMPSNRGIPSLPQENLNLDFLNNLPKNMMPNLDFSTLLQELPQGGGGEFNFADYQPQNRQMMRYGGEMRPGYFDGRDVNIDDGGMVDFLNSNPEQVLFGIENRIGILENQLKEAESNRDRESYDMIVQEINNADAQRIEIMNSMKPNPNTQDFQQRGFDQASRALLRGGVKGRDNPRVDRMIEAGMGQQQDMQTDRQQAIDEMLFYLEKKN
jgi:hypothetical protein